MSKGTKRCDASPGRQHTLRGFFFFSSRRRHTRLQGDWSSRVLFRSRRSGCRSIVHTRTPRCARIAVWYPDPVPISISQPYIVALMTQCLAVRRGDLVLQIGTRSGDQTAILAHPGVRACTIERLPALLVGAERRL